MNSSYDALKESPLARRRDDTAVEEVAIRLEMSGTTICASLKRV